MRGTPFGLSLVQTAESLMGCAIQLLHSGLVFKDVPKVTRVISVFDRFLTRFLPFKAPQMLDAWGNLSFLSQR